MKFNFNYKFLRSLLSTLLFFSLPLSLSGRDLFLITYYRNKSEAETAKKILLQEYGIPLQFVQVRFSQEPCEPKNETIYHLCFDKDGKQKNLVIRQKVLRNLVESFR